MSEYICRSTGIRASRLRLYPEQFLRIKILRPSIDEQREILRCVKVETEEVDSSLDCVQREISLLRESRARLISDVVTGKLDVREAAANLPDEPEEDEDLEPLNAGDSSLEADDYNESPDSDEEPEEVLS